MNAMQIESKIKRAGGTRITMREPDREYHFTPIDPDNPQSPHVAEVAEKAHISRFLSIVEGYQYFGTSGQPDDRPALAGTVEPEPEPPAATEPEPDAAQTGDDAEPAATDEAPESLLRVLDKPGEATREDAVEAFEFLEKRKAHPNAKTPTIVKKVIEAAAVQGWIAETDTETLTAQADAQAGNE